MALVHFNITLIGRVQGVGFRAATAREAQRLGVVGTVCNLPDGSVYVEAEGDSKIVTTFLEWCKHGPPSAHVNKVTSSESPVVNFTNFEITRKS